MTPEQNLLLISVIAGYGLLALVVGYAIGSARTFASLGFGSEGLGEIFRTMRPWFGSRRHFR